MVGGGAASIGADGLGTGAMSGGRGGCGGAGTVGLEESVEVSGRAAGALPCARATEERSAGAKSAIETSTCERQRRGMGRALYHLLARA
jgi:hypothetical protein